MLPELKTEWMKFKRSNAASACFVLKLDADNQTIILDLSKTCSPEVMTTHRGAMICSISIPVHFHHLNVCTSQCLHAFLISEREGSSIGRASRHV